VDKKGKFASDRVADISLLSHPKALKTRFSYYPIEDLPPLALLGQLESK
jgi:hypothetical protein